MDGSELATIAIAIFALVFTVSSFWWLNARRGSLTAVIPPAYAFANGFRLGFPVAVFNDGAVPLLVTDLRIPVAGAGTYPWQTTPTSLKPQQDDGHEFAVPFSINGRGNCTVIAEFGGDYDWRPNAAASYQVCLEALVGEAENWTELVAFTWWSPPSGAAMNRYIAYRNEPSSLDKT